MFMQDVEMPDDGVIRQPAELASLAMWYAVGVSNPCHATLSSCAALSSSYEFEPHMAGVSTRMTNCLPEHVLKADGL